MTSAERPFVQFICDWDKKGERHEPHSVDSCFPGELKGVSSVVIEGGGSTMRTELTQATSIPTSILGTVDPRSRHFRPLALFSRPEFPCYDGPQG